MKMKASPGIKRHIPTFVFTICFLTLWFVATLYLYDVVFHPSAVVETNSMENAMSRMEYEKLLTDKFNEQMLVTSKVSVQSQGPKRLIFYNKPPKTGSTTVRVAMNRALKEKGLIPANCFKHIAWNEALYKTIINHREIDFWGCHIRLTPERLQTIMSLRNGNVTFITNTRPHDKIILSAYLQEHRNENIPDITDPVKMEEEVEKYRKAVETYPIDALYAFHGASEQAPLLRCPPEWKHEQAMHDAAAKYETIIDLNRPKESAVMVEMITGLRPDFEIKFNERTTKKTAMLKKLEAVDTSHKDCGNQLVHRILLQHFNLIKDRMMQNLCFNEGNGSFDLCDKVQLTKEEIKERNRNERYEAQKQLMNI